MNIHDQALTALADLFDTHQVEKFHNEETRLFTEGQLHLNPRITRTIVEWTPASFWLMKKEIQRLARKCPLDATPFSEVLNGKLWTLKDGKVVEFKLSDVTPDTKVVITANDNNSSPLRFSRRLILAEKMAYERHPAARNIVSVGVYQSERNFFLNGIVTMERLNVLKHDGRSLEHIADASKMQQQLMQDLIVARDAENEAIKRNDSGYLLRKDAANILGNISFYGFSGSALINHDAVRGLHAEFRKGHFYEQEWDGEIRRIRNEVTATLIPRITLIAFAPADAARTESRDADDARIIYLTASKTDHSIALLGDLPYLGMLPELERKHRVEVDNATLIDITTDIDRLGGHDEMDFWEQFVEQKIASQGRRR